MSETPPLQPETSTHTLSSFDRDVDISLDLANQPTPRQQFDDDAYLRSVARSRELLDTPQPTKKVGLGEKAVVGSLVTATLVGGAYLANEGISQFEQDQIDLQKQNQEWAEEANTQRLLQEQDFDNGKITIDVQTPPETNK